MISLVNECCGYIILRDTVDDVNFVVKRILQHSKFYDHKIIQPVDVQKLYATIYWLRFVCISSIL